MTSFYLPEGLSIPVPEPDGLSAPYWQALRDGVLKVQRCRACRTWQWGPEWLCHRCLSFEMDWVDISPRGRIYSWERCWHPVHPALAEHGPYIVVLVELAAAGNVRMIGNLLGDPRQAVRIGSEVEGVFEHHNDTSPTYSLLQWRAVS
jgi:uncharacterized OB-fold protein